MNRVLAPIAAVGFVASLIAQIGFWLGLNLPESTASVLFGGIFVVWLPTVFSMRRFKLDGNGSGLWREMLIGAPHWMRPLLYGTFAYAFLNFLLGLLGVFSMKGGGFWRVGTSHAMAFYVAAWGLASAAIGREEQGIEWKCERGHDLSPTAKFCADCGAPAKKRPATGV